MTLLRFHRDDYKESPRRSESSEKVVRYWFDGRVVYDVETAVADEDCLGIIAERIVLRRLLGIDGGEKKHVPYVLDAKPFGEDGPKCAELLLSDVFVAMAFVPLTPPDSRGRPILARLYCVNGLSKRCFPSPLRADAVSDGKLYSWFLTGLPDEKYDAVIDGRSWLLAAELLKHVVTKRDVATARNLVTKFIVTGDVRNGLITKVEMGRKDELALRHAYRDFKWIIPKENDMNNVPKRKIEKPATLEEAYGLIESMQNAVTRAFFQFLRDGNLDRAKEMYRNGADIFGKEEKTGLTCLEIVTQQIRSLYDVEKQTSWEVGKERGFVEKTDEEKALDAGDFKRKVLLPKIELFEKELAWLRLQGADCAMTFYLLAKNGDAEGLQRMVDSYPINFCDGAGATAWDLAFLAEEKDAALMLKKIGASTEGLAARRVRQALDNIKYQVPAWHLKDEKANDIVRALEFGMDPETDVRVEAYPVEDDIGGWCESHECLAVALLYDDLLLERCLQQGVLDVKRNYPTGSEKRMMTLSEYIATWGNEGYKAKIFDILKKYGANG